MKNNRDHDHTYWMKWKCACGDSGNWLVRVDRNFNQMQFYCKYCYTTIKTEILSIEYSA